MIATSGERYSNVPSILYAPGARPSKRYWPRMSEIAVRSSAMRMRVTGLYASRYTGTLEIGSFELFTMPRMSLGPEESAKRPPRPGDTTSSHPSARP